MSNIDNIADTPTPPAMAGTWTLTAPDGREWRASSPIAVCRQEMHERVPADVALARIMREAPAMSIKDQLTLIADRAKALSTEALDIAAGKSARVISKFNGQPFGLSRKPLTAKVLTITCVYVDANCGRVTFWSENAPDAGFGMEDVEFLEDQA